MKTIDIEFSHLCDEIDHWKDQAKYYKNLYEEEQRLNTEHLNKSLEESKKGVAQALMLCLSAKDDADGNLIIEKEDRKALAESYKS